jgi:hypothetical protein
MRLPESQSVVRLPEVFVIGFTAHTSVLDHGKCKRWICDFLSDQKTIESPRLCAVVGMNTEVDLLFAEICIDLKIPLRLLLPVPEQYLQQDFDDSTRTTRTKNIMRSALSLETVVGSEGQEKRHFECSLEMVTQCQELIVLGDGISGGGIEHASEVIAFASTIGKSISSIHPETGVVSTINVNTINKRGADSELVFLNELPSLGKTPPPQGSGVGLGNVWLSKLDANAAAVAPQVRKLAAIPIICTATAAFISGAVSHMHARAGWVGAAAALGLVASLLPTVLRLGKRQALWVRIRTAAEISRSVLAVWDMPASYRIVGPEILPEFTGMLQSLNFLKSLDGFRKPVEVVDFKERYLAERLVDQKRYLLRQSSLSAARGKRFRLAAKICSISAIVLSIWTFIGSTMMKESITTSGLWLSLTTSGLFQLATISGALLVVNDCERRQKRYQALHDQLASLELELRAFGTWTPVIRVVNKVERVLLVELLEWRSLLQNTKLPRK